MQTQFAIFCRLTDIQKIKYLGVDEETGDNYWTSNLSRAHHFKTMQEAQAVFEHRDFNERCVYTDKTSSPPRLIWAGLEINHTKEAGSGTFGIMEIITKTVFSFDITDNIQR